MSDSSVSSNSPHEDPSGPYYLHHSDSLNSLLVTQALNGDNYYTWHYLMSMALTAKNKIKFVDGSIPNPSNSSMLFSSWLLNSMSKEIAANVLYEYSVKLKWSDLKDRFSQASGLQIFQLQKAITSLTQDNLTISAYFIQMKGLWDELVNYRSLPSCSCGALQSLCDLQQQYYVMPFLMRLNDSFINIRVGCLIQFNWNNFHQQTNLLLVEIDLSILTMNYKVTLLTNVSSFIAIYQAIILKLSHPLLQLIKSFQVMQFHHFLLLIHNVNSCLHFSIKSSLPQFLKQQL